MSRIGKLPIKIPTGVTITVNSSDILVKGSKGELTVPMLDQVKVEVKDDLVIVTRNNDEKIAKSQHGLERSLINNAIIGVSQGYEKRLEVNGVGYRLSGGGKSIDLSLGLSHNITYNVKNQTELKVDKMAIIVSGIDKQAVGQTAAEIRSLKKPEPYKGKGIKYADEVLRRKAGKAGS